MARNEKPIGKKTDCIYCEGSKVHWGKPCGACDGTGSEKTRKQIVKIYRAKMGLSLRKRKA